MKFFRQAEAKRQFISVTAACILLLTLSCQKNEQLLEKDTMSKSVRTASDIIGQNTISPSDYQVLDGTIHFKDNDAFLRVHKALAKLSTSDRLKFAQAAGFKSLLTYQDEFIKACEAVEVTKNVVAYEKLLADYADIVYLDASQTLLFKLESPLLASYQDRAGVVYIGKSLYKYGVFDQTIVLDGDRAKLDDPESLIVKHFTYGMNKSNANKGARMASTCQYINDKVTFGQSCNDRHSRLSVLALYQQNQQPNGKYIVTLTPFTLAFPFKKNAFGSWVHYTTDNELYYNWTFTAYTTQPNDPQINDQPYQQSSPYSKRSDSYINNNYSQIDYTDQSVSFSNINSSGAPTVFYSFEFPTNSGWHKMLCNIRNDMICY